MRDLVFLLLTASILAAGNVMREDMPCLRSPSRPLYRFSLLIKQWQSRCGRAYDGAVDCRTSHCLRVIVGTDLQEKEKGRGGRGGKQEGVEEGAGPLRFDQVTPFPPVWPRWLEIHVSVERNICSLSGKSQAHSNVCICFADGEA